MRIIITKNSKRGYEMVQRALMVKKCKKLVRGSKPVNKNLAVNVE